eukprot:UN23776
MRVTIKCNICKHQRLNVKQRAHLSCQIILEAFTMYDFLFKYFYAIIILSYGTKRSVK